MAGLRGVATSGTKRTADAWDAAAAVPLLASHAAGSGAENARSDGIESPPRKKAKVGSTQPTGASSPVTYDPNMFCENCGSCRGNISSTHANSALGGGHGHVHVSSDLKCPTTELLLDGCG